MARTNFSGPVVSDAGFQTTGTVTAGGSSQAILSSGATSPGIFFGSGPPTITAPQGSLYLNTTGSSTSTRAYINTTGLAVWTAVTTAG
jgi:hypothetical protein